MASYTISIRRIIDLYGKDEVLSWFQDYELSDYLTPEEIESIEEHNLWNKEKLANKIIDHYFMREIGYETPALFKHFAKVKMQELMEEYLPIIYSNSIKYNPMVNVDFIETFERDIEGTAENKGNSKSTSESNSSSLSINNDTPQTNISKQQLNSGIYASNVAQNDGDNKINDETNTKNNGKSNTKEKYTRSQKGNSGSLTTAQNLIKQYRDIIRAVDTEIINKLNVLFMGIY